jgi:ribonuclease G
MAKEICISSTPHETRLAILEDDQLAEIYYERENEYTLAGSIYNGCVTRVLPGMQSAFVDLGLERDAFLYVTDFLELEDQEETDELEKAAVSSSSQPPREVRHGAAQESGEPRNGRSGQKSDQKTTQKQEERAAQERPASEKPSRDRRLLIESEDESAAIEGAVPELALDSESASGTQEETSPSGAKRWRGRRRRRGSREAAGSPESSIGSGEGSLASTMEITEAEAEVAPEIHAAAGAPTDRSSSAGWSTRTPAETTSSPSWEAAAQEPAHRSGAPSTPFVLPGESLSKYGGAPAEDAARSAAETATPARPASTFKPSTLIESPLQWDGSGLLPGESLSRHRGRQPEPAEEAVEVETAQPFDAPRTNSLASSASDEEEPVGEITAPGPEFVLEPKVESAPEPIAPATADAFSAGTELFDEEEFDETTETALESVTSSASATWENTDPQLDQIHLAPAEAEAHPSADEVAPEAAEPEADAAASHNVDPLPPAGFRLFGLGAKKKAEEEAAKPVAKPASVPSVSAYAPGSGLIEEEIIEEEEFDAPHHHHHGKVEEHDLDDFEEETLPTQIRTGDLGELLQEAHLEHHIGLDLEEKAEEDEEGFEDEDEDEEASAEGQAGAEGSAQEAGASQPRRDRAGRGRRGRAGSTAQGAPGGRGRGQSRRSAQMSDLPIISDLLKPGQEILVQIAKEPIAKKGARITSHIALPGRFLVFMPTVSHVGVSRKIASDEERQRLKRILIHERGEASGGFIVRTAAEGASEEDLRADLRFLLHLWSEIKQRSDTSKSPALIYHDLSLIERILRDQVSSNFSSIWVDSQDDYERIVRFLNRFSPSLVRRVKLYTKETPLFEHFGIQDEISKALRSKVWLKSGGSIVINQTEALVAIDINTGKYVGKSARLEDTIVKTNLDAVPEIVRQIRLRDLGGIIVIDFIDMDDRKNRYKVMAALEEALKSDRAPTKVLQFNDFGLVAITRKRVKQSLERTLSVPCPTCQATGMVKSPTTVCNEIYTELRKMKKHFEGEDVLLRVNPETVKVLKSNNASWLTEFEELIGKNVLVKSDATLHPEQFDIQG